ncbi:TetR/AcrR family transcriptional regulator [Euzebya tangerina]|uniref:TetR/AcrR family transcriptional regulator n=1 Tax=Euzebya tangerina TaxID=591198 RepID=UPI000E30C30F|nr:TetR/AcrR family transcriptional regulator [Euzebya tangerina]
MRADARRNRQRLIVAATHLILETGGEPPRDAVAARAGVGIATLYRNFPERQDLLRAVVLDVLDRTIAAGHTALAEDGDAALSGYLHAAIDNGMGVVNIIRPLLDQTEWPERTRAAAQVLDQLLHRAKQSGAISQRITGEDITYAAIRFSRPLAIGLDRQDEQDIAHRQLDHYLAGLAADV